MEGGLTDFLSLFRRTLNCLKCLTGRSRCREHSQLGRLIWIRTCQEQGQHSEIIIQSRQEKFQGSTPLSVRRKKLTLLIACFFQNDPSNIDPYVSSILSKINFTTDLNGSVQNTELVIEAIVENLEVKKKLFDGLGKVRDPQLQNSIDRWWV